MSAEKLLDKVNALLDEADELKAQKAETKKTLDSINKDLLGKRAKAGEAFEQLREFGTPSFNADRRVELQTVTPDSPTQGVKK